MSHSPVTKTNVTIEEADQRWPPAVIAVDTGGSESIHMGTSDKPKPRGLL